MQLFERRHVIDLIVLAGGQGTRSADPSIPKSLQSLHGDYTVLQSLADSVTDLPIAQVIAVLGHHEEALRDAFLSIHWGAPVTLLKSINEGTSTAVIVGAEACLTNEALVVMGDSALAIPIDVLYAKWTESKTDVFALCRYSDHPGDSDSVLVDSESRITDLIPKGKLFENDHQGPVVSLSGVILAKTQVLMQLPHGGDFQQNLFAVASKCNWSTKAHITRFFSRDTGTALRLDSARSSFASGSAARRSTLNTGALFIDRDGTIIPNIGDGRKRVQGSELPEHLREAIKFLNDVGVPIFIITNQPGIAKGRITSRDVQATFRDIQFILAESGAVFDDFRFCPHHPEEGWPGEIAELKTKCSCRKPLPGMLESLAEQHHVNLRKSIMIGDSEADRLVALSVGAAFIAVESGNPNSTAQAIREAAIRLMGVS
jgi:mannose-1-phosphate guanylyltransferase/phosphomannomutase